MSGAEDGLASSARGARPDLPVSEEALLGLEHLDRMARVFAELTVDVDAEVGATSCR
jgi:hypothetical protein